MSIPAVNCTTIKPQVSFGKADNDEERLYNYSKFADEVNDKYINSQNVKKPVAAAVSVALAGLIAFASGKLLASKAAIVAEKFKINLPEILDSSLGKLSKLSSDVSGRLIKENPVTKSEKAADLAGKVIAGATNCAKKVYNKVAKSGVTPLDTQEVIKSKAFANLGGTLGVATILPSVCSKDNDENGIADILEKGQNAYTGTKNKMGKLMEDASKFSDLVELLT